MNPNDLTSSPARGLRRRLRHIGGVLLMATFLVAGAAACQPAGCGTNCITIVSINPGANQVSLYTNVNTFGTIQIYSDSDMTQLVAQKSDSNITTAHAINIQQLNPDTKYWWRATAIDTNNQTRSNIGTFHTAIKTVTVTFDKLHLTDDSDAVGSGEMSFSMAVNGKAFPFIYDNQDMGSGETTFPGVQGTVSGPQTSLTIQVEGYDDDCDFFDGLCTGGLGPDWGHGSTSEGDWATATVSGIAIPTYSTTGNWVATTESYKVKFEASGTYTVTYTDAPA